jgi:hypothetical protein
LRGDYGAGLILFFPELELEGYWNPEESLGQTIYASTPVDDAADLEMPGF